MDTKIGWGARVVLGAAIAVAGFAGCGSEDVMGGPPTSMPSNTLPVGPPVSDAQSYFPLTPGARWQYNLVRKGVPTSKVQTVDTSETFTAPKAGVSAVRLKQDQEGEVQLTWFERTGGSVVIHRQEEFDAAGAMKWNEWYVPYDIRIDESMERMQSGGTWSMTYVVERTHATKPPTSKQKVHQFVVESMAETITVAAGTFQTVRVRRSDPTDGSYRQYWYARGVGKVRELEGNGDSEELAAHSGQ